MTSTIALERSPDRASFKGLRQFLNPDQQRAWLDGESNPPDAVNRTESLKQRFKNASRFEKLLRRPQAQDVLDILRLNVETCIVIPAREQK